MTRTATRTRQNTCRHAGRRRHGATIGRGQRDSASAPRLIYVEKARHLDRRHRLSGTLRRNPRGALRSTGRRLCARKSGAGVC